MAWPIAINGHTYNESDFAGYGYQSAMPSAFNDVETRANDAEAAAVAAAASETAAGLSEAAAAGSAAAAAALAASFVGTSTTSLAIAIASKTFVTQAGESYSAGIWMTAVSAGDSANWMFGEVTSYSGTSLVIDVQAIGGSGTHADWNLSLAGPRGPAGTGVLGGFSITLTGNVTMSGAYNVGMTFPGAYTYTFPGQTDTLAALGLAQNWTKPQRPSLIAEFAPSSNTVTLDLTAYNIFPINLSANITTMNLTGTLANLLGNQYRVNVRYNGGTTISWNANFKFPGGTAPTPTGTSGKIDSFCFEVMSTDGGTTCYLECVGYTQNL